jgi:transposase
MTLPFLIDDETWRVIQPLLAAAHSGPERVDDRRVLSGICHVLMTGSPWAALPSAYGPPTTIYNRYVRWKDRPVWRKMVRAIEAAGTAPDVATALAQNRRRRAST